MKNNDELMLQLIKFYCYVSDVYDSTLCVEVQRLSHNDSPKFTDIEVITTYLWGLRQEHYRINSIHTYIKNHYHDCFPSLPNYKQYVNRVNLLAPAFTRFLEILMQDGEASLESETISLLDSFPIVLANGKRKNHAKVARECCSEGYCASKDMHYYGAKIHIMGFRRAGKLPMPEYAVLTPANTHDLKAMQPVLEKMDNREVYADKAYIDQTLSETMLSKQSLLLTPIKRKKGQTAWEDHFFGAANRLFSTAVSRVRQPIESFFNWLDVKTSLQRASFVRSPSGFMSFVFGRLVFALLLLLGLI